MLAIRKINTFYWDKVLIKKDRTMIIQYIIDKDSLSECLKTGLLTHFWVVILKYIYIIVRELLSCSKTELVKGIKSPQITNQRWG